MASETKLVKPSKKGGKKKLEQIIEVVDVPDTLVVEDDDSDDGSSRKKRGRKPKDKFKFDSAGMMEGQSKELEENIIVKLPLSCLALSNEMMPSDGITYNPTLTIPEPYDKPHANFSDIDGNILSVMKDDKIISNGDILGGNDKLCAKCHIAITGKEKPVDDTEGTRQIDIILNNKYGCNAEKIQILAQICSTVLENKWPTSVDIACYRCCHTFSNTPWGIPIKYQNGKFYLTGMFCTPNCVLGYILNESRNDESQWEKIALLHMLYYHVFGSYVNIMPSPDKICLQMFGGSVDIQTYRNITNDNHKSYTVEFPPCNTIIPMLEEIYKKNNLFSSFLPNEKLSDKLGDKLKTSNGKVLKLKRFTPINSTRNSLDQVLKISG